MPRLFVAIDLPTPIRSRLVGLCGGMRGAKWMPADQIHLTLRFIGEVDNGRLSDIAEALTEVGVAPFSISLSGVGHFPPRGKPKVLWAGVADGAAVTRLHHKIEVRLQRLGLPPDARKFAPHVTLARLKGAPVVGVGDFLARNCLFVSDGFTVSEFHLYSSHLGSAGAVHRIETSYALDAEA